jgi:CHAD domain-containing protein
VAWTTAELGLQVLREQGQAFAEHAAQAQVADSDPEHVHQTRVATRRLRAALRVFEDVLPPDVLTLEDELGWIAGQFGPLRDLDVQVRRLQDSASQLGLSAVLLPYGAWLEAQRQRSVASLDTALQSQRFCDLARRLTTLDHFVADAASSVAVTEDAPQRLQAAWRKLRKVARKLRDSSPSTAFHQSRIRAKRLRYTTEFFERVYGKPARRLIKRTISLQDLLGDHQDGVVSTQRIQAAVQVAAREWPAETSLALGRVVQWETERGYELRRHFRREFREVEDAWQRLRRVL